MRGFESKEPLRVQAPPLTSHLTLPRLHFLIRKWDDGSDNTTCSLSSCEDENSSLLVQGLPRWARLPTTLEAAIMMCTVF